MITAAERERRTEVLTDALRRSGLRVTYQRLEIVREIAGTDEHPYVEHVYRAVRERIPTVALDTVYRTLGTLADIGAITRVAARSGSARYDANGRQHHHFVCTRCGLISDIESSELDTIEAPQEAAALGEVESVEVQLRGVCAACALRLGSDGVA
jgi:Fur family peroxide stress response transcriptional regulator